jgi:hypothetical protein
MTLGKWCSGLEPAEQVGKGAKSGKEAGESGKADPCHSPRIPGQAGEEMAEIVTAWPNLSPEIRHAILTLLRAAKRDGQ